MYVMYYNIPNICFLIQFLPFFPSLRWYPKISTVNYFWCEKCYFPFPLSNTCEASIDLLQ